MKPKGLLFTLFILYWIAVYGVALFSFGFRNDFRKTTISHIMPFGYSMFTPLTKTKFNVLYEFYDNGKPVKTISLEQYLVAEYEKGLFHNKISTIKSRIYFEQIYQLDLAYQKNQYAKANDPEIEDFDSVIKRDANLNAIVNNISNFSKLYLKEKSILADSVIISIERNPMILPFAPDYKNDYTYVLGKKVFYKTSLNFPGSNSEL